MAYPTFIGARYLHSKSKRSISVISVIAIAGVALGVASLLVVMSITSGFQDEFTKKVLGVNAHVLVMKYGVYFNEYREVMKKIKELPEVRGASPFVYQEMMISSGEKTSGVLIKGVDPERIGTVLDLPTHIVEGGLDGLRVPGFEYKESKSEKKGVDLFDEKVKGDIAPKAEDFEKKQEEATEAKKPGEPGPVPGIVLGRTLAENLEIKVGDLVQITTPMIGISSLGWSPTEDTPQTITFKVIGMFYAGFLEYDTHLAYVDYFQAQRFFKYGDSVHGVEVTINDISKATETSERILKALDGPPYHTVDWETLNRPLYTALMMQKVVLIVIVTILVGIAAFNIIATLVMMVFDKRREIAILKSMGASRGGIALIFLHVGTVVGLMGIAIGLIVGLGVCLLLLKVGWPLDPKVYLIDHLPVRIESIDFVLTAVITFLICLLSTLIPSLSAARLRPVDGIRQQ